MISDHTFTRDNWQSCDSRGHKHTDVIEHVGVECVLHFQSLYVGTQFSPKHRQAQLIRLSDD